MLWIIRIVVEDSHNCAIWQIGNGYALGMKKVDPKLEICLGLPKTWPLESMWEPVHGGTVVCLPPVPP